MYRTRAFVTRTTALVAVGALSLGLAACGSASKDAAPVVAVSGAKLTTLRASSNALQDAGSARFTMQMSGDQIEMKATGVVDTKAPATEIQMTMSAKGKTVTMTQRLVDGVAYMKSDLLAQMGMGGWLKIDLSAAGLDVDELSRLGGGSDADPTSQSQFLNGLEDVKNLGTEDVDGVTTTHYKGAANLKTAFDEVTKKLGEDSDAAKSLQKMMMQIGGGTPIPVEAWIDAQNRPVKLTYTMPLGNQTVVTTLQYSDFGTPVNVQAPPANEVRDISSLVGGGALGSNS